MKVILKENIEKLGFKDEIVDVKNGFARNFLIPKNKAVIATENAIKVLNENLRQQESKLKEEIENANKTLEELSKLNIVIKSKLQEDGKKLFGSISSKQLVDEIGKHGIEIDRKFVKLNSVKEIGSYTAEIRLHRKVNCSLEFKVVSDKN
uniref:Large ribosomal subunit protein bL9 n=1 Tax=uncultured Flavobacteriia bacterium TaxID=212695 RepID=F4MMY5_9BACT|nr:LSU ribosomal protein L9p [uncultured bacterium]CBL87498.1 Ribosomal protein L9 [uncultured Flavobacteriia bacterium]